jgi:hypothetical protein
MDLPAGWLFSRQRKGHSRIRGTANTGFATTGIKQARTGENLDQNGIHE